MKNCFISFLLLVGAVQGFAPNSQGRSDTQLASLFDRISNMDLFAPKADQNTYGARYKKDVSYNRLAQFASQNALNP